MDSYRYKDLSNKVIKVDRRLVDTTNGPTGDPESLIGRISVDDLGSNLKKRGQATPAADKTTKKSKKNESQKGARPKNLFIPPDLAPGLRYYPSDSANSAAHGSVMAWVQKRLEDVSHDVICSATDSILEAVLDGSNDADILADRRRKVSEVVGDMSDIEYNGLLAIAKTITDYHTRRDDDANDQKSSTIAISFDEGEEEDDDDERDDDEHESEQQGADGPEFQLSDGEETVGAIENDGHEPESIPVSEIDELWLENKVGKELVNPVFEILATAVTQTHAYSQLMELLNNDCEPLVKLLASNRLRIVWYTRLAKAGSNDEKTRILNEIENLGLKFPDETSELPTSSTPAENISATSKRAPRIVDLDALVFEEGSRLYSGGKLTLPAGSTKVEAKSYEQYSIPALLPRSDRFNAVAVNNLPVWAQAAFAGMDSLNRVQSKVYPCAIGTEQNMLVCAPTGAGKTNIALLTMLETIGRFRRSDGTIELNDFKMVYIAPLKALVQEQVANFRKRLEPFGINVEELTGDSNLTRYQIENTQLLVATPEKWDVITRKSSDLSYVDLVRLIIVDEIHLLHDERGPVLESIIARTVRNAKTLTADESVRLVGLSATLPNYMDVATFMRVPEKNVFYFDATYRPCPLAQKFVGITEKSAFKRIQAENECCFEKVMDFAGKQQVLVFVHSRKETAKTAKFLRARAEEDNVIDKFVTPSIKRELYDRAQEIQHPDLKDLLGSGFAIHHAGLSRQDRNIAEESFKAGLVQVLVCTATLAWGVNLPAHTVIIKGTQVYNPEKGTWTELSPQDVLQMLGRAGRPGFDDSGEGIIITNHSELNYYMSLMNAKLPIESQFMAKLADNLNAEIVLGNVTSREQAVDWLGYTYLYVRMIRAPKLYRLGADYDLADEKAFYYRREDLIHSALTVLADNGLVKYEPASGRLKDTTIGQIASHFYISHSSMTTYNRSLKPYFTSIELLGTFAKSEEFKYIPIRQEERQELGKLMEIVPIPVNTDVDDPASKINVLLQAYISRLRLEGFAMMVDMIYITQSASRLLRALYELCLHHGWAELTRECLALCKMVEHRIWLSSSPFSQFPDCPKEVIRKTESSQMPWSHYFLLSDAAEVGQAIRSERHGKQVYEMLKHFPRIEIFPHVYPITPSLVKVEVDINSNFEWNNKMHGSAESFVVLVEDNDGETILYDDHFLLRREHYQETNVIDFTINLPAGIWPPHFFISFISERWLHCETKTAVSLRNVVVPKKFPALTKMTLGMDLSIPESLLKELQFSSLNDLQKSSFQSVYENGRSVFIGSPVGSGKTALSELALLRHLKSNNPGKVVYLAPFQDQIDAVTRTWLAKYGSITTITQLSGESATDSRLLAQNEVILATPEQWDLLSRKWAKRRNIQAVSLLIADDIHTLGGIDGHVYERVLARMRKMVYHSEKDMRIIAMSVSLTNAKDLSKWLGITDVLNFTPEVPERIIHLQSTNIFNHKSMMMSLAHPVVSFLLSSNAMPYIYVNSRDQCFATYHDLCRVLLANNRGDLIQKANDVVGLVDLDVQECLSHGFGIIYSGMAQSDRKLVLQHSSVAIIATYDSSWKPFLQPRSKRVVIMGTEIYYGAENRYINYQISDILQMLGSSKRCLLLTSSNKRSYYKKFLEEALPIESQLSNSIADSLIPEIAEGNISSLQDCIDWLTFTFLYWRLTANPSFYGCKDASSEGLSDFLSDLVENAVDELKEAEIVELSPSQTESEDALDNEEGTFSATSNAIISSFYNISFITMQTFGLSLNEKTRLRGMIEIVTSAAEFDVIPVSRDERDTLANLYSLLPIKVSGISFEQSRFKALILLQAHISRINLPIELKNDQQVILGKILSLLHGIIDIQSSNGYLNAMSAIDLAQMIVQAVWDKDSPLKQIPHFSNEMIKRANENDVESVSDFMSLEDDQQRLAILGVSEEEAEASKEVADIVEFVNSYPSIEMGYRWQEDGNLLVTIEREMDEGESIGFVKCDNYPLDKIENWWIILGHKGTKQLFAIRKAKLNHPKQEIMLEIPEEVMEHVSELEDLTLFCTTDSYVDADVEVQVSKMT